MNFRSRAVVALLAMLTLFSAVASAQEAATAEPVHHAFVIANVTLGAATQGTLTSAARQTVSPFWGTSLAYQVPMPFGGEVGGGFLVTPFVGFGVDYAYAYSHGNPAVAVRTDISDEMIGVTKLRRAETAAHLQIVVKPKTSRDTQLLLYGGPTYFKVNQEMIDSLFTSGASLDGYTFSEQTANAWGYNFGADMTAFLHRNAGLGVTLRYSRATVQMRDSAKALLGEDGTQPVTAGGFVFGFGLRLRF
ncbi:MAG: hypothetical protein ACM3NQ_24780 [Bacteroidales bacterium]